VAERAPSGPMILQSPELPYGPRCSFGRGPTLWRRPPRSGIAMTNAEGPPVDLASRTAGPTPVACLPVHPAGPAHQRAVRATGLAPLRGFRRQRDGA
jgi:hypothetical protein